MYTLSVRCSVYLSPSNSLCRDSVRRSTLDPRKAAVDLVVLADYLVADSRMLRDMHSQGVPHLPVRVRDGTGLVGPLVIPGVTSCLGNH